MTKDNEDGLLTPEEKAFADAHGFYEAEASEWLVEMEKYYGYNKVPPDIDLSYITDENGNRVCSFDGPDGETHSFVSKVDTQVCAFAEAHGFGYGEAKVWYDEMEKVYGKGKVPEDASLEYHVDNDGNMNCTFGGKDGTDNSFVLTVDDQINAFADIHGMETAEAKKWYDEMAKVYGKGHVPLDAPIEYAGGGGEYDICIFEGPDGVERSFRMSDDVRDELSAQRKIHDLAGKHSSEKDAESHFDEYVRSHRKVEEDEQVATPVRTDEGRDR